MGPSMKETFLKMTCTEKAYMSGKMDANTPENEKITKWKGKELSVDSTDGSLLENMWLIRSTEKEYFNGQMGGSMKGNGKRENNTALGYSPRVWGLRGKAIDKMAKESAGKTKITSKLDIHYTK